MAIIFPTNPSIGQSLYIEDTRYVFDGVAWSQSVTNSLGTRRSKKFTSTLNQVEYQCPFSVDNADIFVDGIKLDNTDYIVNNNGLITLNTALNVGSNVEVVGYGVYDILHEIFYKQSTQPENPVEGALWFDIANSELKYFDGSTESWTTTNYRQTRETFTAIDNQTIFNVENGYNVGYVDVYLNGLKLINDDFIATDGLNIVLTTGASLNDIVDVVAYSIYSLTDVYTKTEIDSKLENILVEEVFNTSGTTEVAIDSFSSSTFRSAEYTITCSTASSFMMIKALIIHNGTTAFITMFGELGTNLGTFETRLYSGNVELLYTPNVNGVQVKFNKTLTRL